MILLAKLLFIVTVALFVRKSQAQYPTVPCPDTFQYAESDGEVYGIVTTNANYGQTKLMIKLSQPERTKSDFIGRISRNYEDNTSNYIESGTPIMYRVTFDDDGNVPKVISIFLNDTEICSGPKALRSEYRITLRHTLRVPFPRTKNVKQENPYIMTTKSPRSPYERPIPSYGANDDDGADDDIGTDNDNGAGDDNGTDDDNYTDDDNGAGDDDDDDEWAHINSICGEQNSDSTTKLVDQGQVKTRPTFPWTVALYKNNLLSVRFQCGGSLITTRTVITAAHCFYTGFERIKDEDILIALGKYNVNDWTSSYISHLAVEKVIQHPEYNTVLERSDADLAIVQLERSVMFSYSIRPICLWKEKSDITGVSGIVVGWGRDPEMASLSPSPRLVKVNVVLENYCLRANKEFVDITSNRTLCAGNNYGHGNCPGDSGNGLMIEMGNKWMLKGIVSLNLGIKQCTIEEYTVYTDIAKFMDWIYANSVF